MSIGVVCYPTFGGSGIVATEIAHGMARRGHTVHVISHDVPRRLSHASVRFHQVNIRGYPVFPQPQYALALASTIVSVAQYEGIDLLHVHYAVPHATSAWMAREILGPRAPALVTTLHGTDITLVGSDESYLPITRHALGVSDALTAPSAFLRGATWQRLALDPLGTPIEVIPNFVDVDRYAPADDRDAAVARLAALWDGDPTVPVLVHVSNFRPVKRVPWVVELLHRIRRTTPCRLLLIGDGPERSRVEARIRKLGLRDHVRLLGQQARFEALLQGAAAFVLPSETESFGLAALEALSSGIPVVASRVGGLEEVVRHGETGLLAPADDLDAMAAEATTLVGDPGRAAEMGRAARADVLDRFRSGPLLDRYAALYRRVLAARGAAPFPVD